MRLSSTFRPAISLAVIAVLGVATIGLASNAEAVTTVYASPAGTATTICSQAVPCSLTDAVTVAGSGGTVFLEGGTYQLVSDPGPGLSLTAPLTLRAAPGARPIVTGNSTVQGSSVITTSADLVVDGLTITGGYIGLSTHGTSLSLLDSSVSNNGNTGLLARGGPIVLRNDTFSGNQTAIFVFTGPNVPFTMTSSTIAGNSAGLVFFQSQGPVNLGGDVIAGNSGGDCLAFQPLVDEGFNIDSDGSCQLTNAGSISGSTSIAASVGPLADNGGPTDTMALAAGSPAIGLVTAALADTTAICGTADQRRDLRPTAPCDAGAYETAPLLPPHITTTTLPAATAGLAYSAPVTVTGVPASTVTATGLPDGLTINPATGAISGSARISGSYVVTVSATNGVAPAATQTLTLLVQPSPVVISTRTALPSGQVGKSYDLHLTATGGADSTYTWSLASGSVLPAGVFLSTTGVLTGTPTAAGTYHFTLSVNDPTTAVFTLVIAPAASVAATTTPAPAGSPAATPTTSSAVFATAALAATGSSAQPTTLWALVLLLAGALLVIVARRRRS